MVDTITGAKPKKYYGLLFRRDELTKLLDKYCNETPLSVMFCRAEGEEWKFKGDYLAYDTYGIKSDSDIAKSEGREVKFQFESLRDRVTLAGSDEQYNRDVMYLLRWMTYGGKLDCIIANDTQILIVGKEGSDSFRRFTWEIGVTQKPSWHVL